jgi:hypothetical protein
MITPSGCPARPPTRPRFPARLLALLFALSHYMTVPMQYDYNKHHLLRVCTHESELTRRARWRYLHSTAAH